MTQRYTSEQIETLFDIIKSRRSIRKFSSQMPEKWQLEKVIEAGMWAPSGHNKQPWAFIVVTDEATKAALAKDNAAFCDIETLNPFYNAPAYIIVLARKDSRTYLYDGALAIGQMMVAAHALGLGTCWIHRARQTFEMAKWQTWLKTLGFEGEYEGIGHLAIGYPDCELPNPRPRAEGLVRFV